jgi:hypothetical protein
MVETVPLHIRKMIVLVNLTTLKLVATGRFLAYFIQRLESPRLRDLRTQIEGSKGYTPELVLTMMLGTITLLSLHDRLENLDLSLKNLCCPPPNAESHVFLHRRSQFKNSRILNFELRSG